MKTLAMLTLCGALMAQQAFAQTPGDAKSLADAANQAEALKAGHLSPRQRAELEKAALAKSNAQAEAGFLAANRRKPGVVALPSGVQYKVLAAGSGARHPVDASTVLCRYQGALADGASFDRSDDKAASALKVSGLVPGLREAVKLMNAGARWEVVVPPERGFGPRGTQGVPPNAVLVYTIEIVTIQ